MYRNASWLLLVQQQSQLKGSVFSILQVLHTFTNMKNAKDSKPSCWLRGNKNDTEYAEHFVLQLFGKIFSHFFFHLSPSCFNLSLLSLINENSGLNSK